MNLVLLDKNAKAGGLLCLEYTATNAAMRAILAKLAAANSIWDSKIKPEVQKAASAQLGRPVVLLNGNYTIQKKGVVTYHGAVPLPGAKYMPRKTWDSSTGKFRFWVVVK